MSFGCYQYVYVGEQCKRCTLIGKTYRPIGNYWYSARCQKWGN